MGKVLDSLHVSCLDVTFHASRVLQMHKDHTGEGCDDEELAHDAIAEAHSGFGEGWHIVTNTLHTIMALNRCG